MTNARVKSNDIGAKDSSTLRTTEARCERPKHVTAEVAENGNGENAEDDKLKGKTEPHEVGDDEVV